MPRRACRSPRRRSRARACRSASTCAVSSGRSELRVGEDRPLQLGSQAPRPRAALARSSDATAGASGRRAGHASAAGPSLATVVSFFTAAAAPAPTQNPASRRRDPRPRGGAVGRQHAARGEHLPEAPERVERPQRRVRLGREGIEADDVLRRVEAVSTSRASPASQVQRSPGRSTERRSRISSSTPGAGPGAGSAPGGRGPAARPRRPAPGRSARSALP